jgi:hypothetical protein
VGKVGLEPTRSIPGLCARPRSTFRSFPVDVFLAFTLDEVNYSSPLTVRCYCHYHLRSRRCVFQLHHFPKIPEEFVACYVGKFIRNLHNLFRLKRTAYTFNVCPGFRTTISDAGAHSPVNINPSGMFVLILVLSLSLVRACTPRLE